MKNQTTLRKSFLRAIVAACAGVFVSAFAGAEAVYAQSAEKVSVGIIAKDGSGIVPTLLSANNNLQEKYGVKVEAKAYPSVTTVWTAFTAGEVDVLIGGPAAFGGLAVKGVPVRLISTYTTSDAQLFGKGDQIRSADDLKGKRVTAIVAGLWKLTQAQIMEAYGLEPGNGYDMIPTPNLLAGVNQVLAGTADIAMGWEPDASRVRATYPELKVVLQSSDLRPAGEPSHIQVLGALDRLSDETAKKLVDALSETAETIKADPVAAEETFVQMSGAQKGLLVDAIKSGRYNFGIHPLTAEDQKIINSDVLKTLPAGSSLPDTFFQE